MPCRDLDVEIQPLRGNKPSFANALSLAELAVNFFGQELMCFTTTETGADRRCIGSFSMSDINGDGVGDNVFQG